MPEERDLGVLDEMERILKQWCVFCRSELKPLLKKECIECTAFQALDGYEKLKKSTNESPGCVCSLCLNRGGKGCTREDMKEMHHKGNKYLLSTPTLERAQRMKNLLTEIREDGKKQ